MPAALALSAAPAHAKGKGKDKHYTVSSDRAVTVTRNVLVRQGYDVVPINPHDASMRQRSRVGMTTVTSGLAIIRAAQSCYPKRDRPPRRPRRRPAARSWRDRPPRLCHVPLATG